MIRRALACAVLAVPALAVAEPLPVRSIYAPHAHPPGPGAGPRPDDNGAAYDYVAFGQRAAMAGAGAAITQAQPLLSVDDFHTLAEISVESADGQQIVELGWDVDVGVNGSVEPHLFSFHWINGAGTCYDGCNFVQVSATHAPGSEIPADGSAHAFQIEHRDDLRWWLTYDGDDLGYYPDTEWTNPPFTTAGLTQWFGEVAAGTEATPCTQMGDGMPGATSDGAASFAGIYTISADGSGGSGSAQPASVGETAITRPTVYSAGAVSATGFRFGGGTGSATCAYQRDTPAVDGAPVDAGRAVDAGNADDGSGGGCCQAGGSGGSAVMGAALVAIALRRRRAGTRAIRMR